MTGSRGAAPGEGRPDGTGPGLTIGNEFAEVTVHRVETRNGARLLLRSARTGASISLCPLELEALTRQNTATFSAMIGRPHAPLLPDAGG